jgi:hypothetical protein
MNFKMERKMRKTLILIAVLLFSICFSACESVSAHSPPVQKSVIQKEKVFAAAVVSEETPRNVSQSYEPSSGVFIAREFALENKITAELAPAERSNPISIVNPNENYQKGTNNNKPPDRFTGFGSDNNARAKI